MQPVSRDGMRGYQFVGSVNSAINQGNKVTDPNASEGVLVASKGRVLFTVLTVTTTTGQARQFLATVVPA